MLQHLLVGIFHKIVISMWSKLRCACSTETMSDKECFNLSATTTVKHSKK